MHLCSWYIAIPASQSSVITLRTVQATTIGLDLGLQALPSHYLVPAIFSRQPLPCPSLRPISASTCLAHALVFLSSKRLTVIHLGDAHGTSYQPAKTAFRAKPVPKRKNARPGRIFLLEPLLT